MSNKNENRTISLVTKLSYGARSICDWGFTYLLAERGVKEGIIIWGDLLKVLKWYIDREVFLIKLPSDVEQFKVFF